MITSRRLNEQNAWERQEMGWVHKILLPQGFDPQTILPIKQ